MENFEEVLFDDNMGEETEDLEKMINAIHAMSSSSSSSSSSEDEECEDHPSGGLNMEILLDRLNGEEFKTHMRLRKETANFLVERFKSSPHFEQIHRAGKSILAAKKNIYMYVWYVSNTITFRQLAVLFGVAKSTAWIAVNRATRFLLSIGHEYVIWPDRNEMSRIADKFEAKAGVPGVIGAIDCTHVVIKAPTEYKESYFGRNRNYSIVLQAVVDPEKRFTSISCGEPGSLHDSRVLKRSELYRRAQEPKEEMFPNDTFILGDSAYAASSWLVPPFKDNGSLTESQKKFNKIISVTRIVVENAFGLLKSRFRRVLHFTEQSDLTIINNLVTSACILHNICITMDDLHEPLNIGSDNETGNSEDEPLEYDVSDGPVRRTILFADFQNRNII